MSVDAVMGVGLFGGFRASAVRRMDLERWIVAAGVLSGRIVGIAAVALLVQRDREPFMGLNAGSLAPAFDFAGIIILNS
jgi:hypothetical protein